MRSFWSDPFLWIHLAGFAALPLWLEICWLGLAAGNPVLPFWLELLVVAAIGITPIFWMQWQRPFYIFSLIAVVLKPERLTEDQQRLLTLFKAQRNRYLAIAAAVVAFLALRQLYYLAPIAAPVTPFTSESRWLGVGMAAIGFLGVNLFLQVPISVLSVMLTGESTFATTTPYPIEQIRSNFTLLGIPVNQILPPVLPEPVVAEANLGLTSPPETEIPDSEVPATEPEAESISQAEAEWLEEAVTPTIIPDGELERFTDNGPIETIRTEEDLEVDLWDVETEIAPEPASQEAVNPSVESEAYITAEAPTHPAATANEASAPPEAIADEATVDSVEDINLEEPTPSVEVVTSTTLDDSAASTEAAHPATMLSSEVISTSEEPTTAEELTSSETLLNSEEVDHSEADNSGTIADSEAPIQSETIADFGETPLSSEAIIDSADSDETPADSEGVIDSEEPISSEAIADSEASTTAETTVDSVETINPEMVAAAPTEAPPPAPDSLPSNHQAPEDHKE